MAGPGRIEGVFSPYDWVVVGECDTATSLVQSGQRDIERLCQVAYLRDLAAFGDDAVLAGFAA